MTDVRWETVCYLKTYDEGPVDQHRYAYELTVPGFLAEWDAWDYWERARTESMASLLNRDDILFDVGAETGWLSAVYARMVGPGHLALIEPSRRLWPNIRQTWAHNFDQDPLATVCALVGHRDRGRVDTVIPWSKESEGDLFQSREYVYLHDNPAGVPEITLDTLVRRLGIVPTALTIDAEGAELEILRGAGRVLRDCRPMVWVSVHPDLLEKHFQVTSEDLMDHMMKLGYAANFPGADHEEHWLFRHSKGR